MLRPMIAAREPARSGAADWLCLAAAPTFALMALFSFVGGSRDMLCSAMHDALPLNGMTMMYLLMSAFHASPWLKLITGRRGAGLHLLASTHCNDRT